MRILWLCNIPLPIIANSISIPVVNSGGWLDGLSKDLMNKTEVELGVCFPTKPNKQTYGNVGKLKYYSFVKTNGKKNNSVKDLEEIFIDFLKDFKPDVVHIWGTEYLHSLAMTNATNKLGMLDNTVISIQGLVSIYSKHYMANLPHEVYKGRTIRNIILRDYLEQGRKDFKKRGLSEIKALNRVKHVIGRTDWDKACTQMINPNAKYHFCNETLRDEFYKQQWDFSKCEKNSIFMSQATYPIKGLHFMLEALPEIIKRYPDTHLYIAGNSIVKNSNIKDKIKRTYYGKHILSLIKKYKLENHITFTGNLDEKEMCNRYLKSNVFVSASSIENSPNSVGEAMLLGVPVVTSDVGGVKNLLRHEREGFVYQHDASYMLAYYVCEIFKSSDLAKSFSEKAREHAWKTHNKNENTKTLLEIYRKLC
ncbi:glycosyltransferase family 4 protein [Sutcliffiella horikoshii]|uniref:glycosyltransferase family 4 protein n=1 Tax=Sutcliffiella horikoshii TaxID=79883 RepID=UPI003CE684A1